LAISLRLTLQPTDDEMLELSRRNPGLQIERDADGGLIVTPTGAEAGHREAELLGQLHRWAVADGSGIVFSPSTGFHLPAGSLLCPDASWMRRERWDALPPAERTGFAHLCPDAVFEILSGSDVPRVLQAKMQGYLTNGALLAVLIDPRRRVVEVYLPGQDPRAIEEPRLVTLDPVLPGFNLDVRPIFD
jgi:Uma2 family endonuclease